VLITCEDFSLFLLCDGHMLGFFSIFYVMITWEDFNLSCGKNARIEESISDVYFLPNDG
jgi:hypothetical protein